MTNRGQGNSTHCPFKAMMQEIRISILVPPSHHREELRWCLPSFSKKTFLFLLTAGPFNQRCSNHWRDSALASSKHGLHPSYLITFSSCATMLLSCSRTKLQGNERHREERVSLLMFGLSLLLFAMISEGKILQKSCSWRQSNRVI